MEVNYNKEFSFNSVTATERFIEISKIYGCVDFRDFFTPILRNFGVLFAYFHRF
jgi:hypothetical protein